MSVLNVLKVTLLTQMESAISAAIQDATGAHLMIYVSTAITDTP
jgi:hypothetical protein